MGAFAKRATQIREDWENRLQKQKAELHALVPSVEQETAAEALNRIKELRRKSFLAGYLARKSRQRQDGVEELIPRDTRGVPGREIAISLPGSKEAGVLDAFVRPAREAAEDVKMDALRQLDQAKTKGTTVTSDPGTLPWYYPMAALTVPNAFAAGFQRAEKDLDEDELKRVSERLAKAQSSFEQALSAEYRDRGKAASAGDLVDGLSRIHVKSAEGELNQMLGTYLALAALLGQGAHTTSREWVARRDPKRQKLKAVREAIRQRMRAHPPSVRIEPATPSLDTQAVS